VDFTYKKKTEEEQQYFLIGKKKFKYKDKGLFVFKNQPILRRHEPQHCLFT
jgi:hypothetical protein